MTTAQTNKNELKTHNWKNADIIFGFYHLLTL